MVAEAKRIMNTLLDPEDASSRNFLQLDTDMISHTFFQLKNKLDEFKIKSEKGPSEYYNNVFIMISRMADRVS